MLMSALKPLGELENATEFSARHIGPHDADEQHMLRTIAPGLPNFTRRALIEAIVPRAIARSQPMQLRLLGASTLAGDHVLEINSDNRLVRPSTGDMR